MGRPRNIWPKERAHELVRLREQGLTWKEIGAKLGLPHVTCSRFWQQVLGRPAFRVTRPRHQERSGACRAALADPSIQNEEHQMRAYALIGSNKGGST